VLTRLRKDEVKELKRKGGASEHSVIRGPDGAFGERAVTKHGCRIYPG